MDHLCLVVALSFLCQPAEYAHPSQHPKASGYVLYSRHSKGYIQPSRHPEAAQVIGHQLTLCPDDYLPRNGCVTLDQLLSGNFIKSNTTLKFMPVVKMEANVVIRFVNVSNITLDTAGPHRANISCIGENSGFIFNHVSRLTIKNIRFIGCGGFISGVTPNTYSTLSLLNSSDVVLTNVAFERGKGCGVFGDTVYGYMTILNTVFEYMQGPGFCLYNMNAYNPNKPPQNFSNQWQVNITISNSVFDSGYCRNDHKAFAVDIKFGGQKFPSQIHITDVTVINNTYEGYTSGVSILSGTSPPAQISIKNFNYSNNRFAGNVYSTGRNPVFHSDIMYLISAGVPIGNYKPVIEIIDSNVAGNDFGEGIKSVNLLMDVSDERYGLFLSYDAPMTMYFSLRNVTISDNIGRYVAMIHLQYEYYNSTADFEMRDLIIANNIFSPSVYYNNRRVISLNNIHSTGIAIHNCSIVNNSATGLLIENSYVHFSGVNLFSGNSGYNGGGMAIEGSSFFSIAHQANVIFVDNLAENFGGGVYAQISQHVCFFGLGTFQRHSSGTLGSLEFNNNSAKTAGNDFHGDNLYACELNENISRQEIAGIFHSPDNYSIEATSDPLHVCDCSTGNNQDCIHIVRTVNTIQTHPGKLFSLSLVAVGQVLLDSKTLSGVPTTIFASILPLHSLPGNIPDSMLAQNVQRNCSELEYRVRSRHRREVMALALNSNLNKIPEYFVTLWQLNDSQWKDQVWNLFYYDLTVPAYVVIELLPCPLGYELRSGECKCLPYLLEFVTCSIDTSLTKRKSTFWLSAAKKYFENGSNSTVYLTHKHCPFDYCNSSNNFEFSLEEPDAQCNHNRSGVLCGECKAGYSLTLGRMECRQCTNIYILLLIPFTFAAIFLIIFLSLSDITVAAGTINGLLFFANVLSENQATFFPPQAAEGFLSVFIAWLNLDFGIGTCFYDGLDHYTFTWLQLSFPIFIWFLAFSIIIASRHVAFMNKVCGRNIVQVLATLFLLSYTKLQRAIVTSLSFTAVEVSDGSKRYVWLVDGNVLYLQGKHVPLFLVTALFVLVLFIYTLSILLGPWLQAKTHYKVFCWMIKFKPFFDAYFGPLKDKHRYWTGVLLLSRMILSLISAVNVFGDDRVNLLVIVTLTFLLLTLLWQSGGVYKTWAFSALDSFFLVNLGLVSTLTLYNKDSGGSQYATVCVSTGSAFAVFCLILFYHCLKKVLKCKYFFSKFRQGPILLERDSNSTDNSDDAVLNAIDEGRDYDPTLHFISTDPEPCNLDTY